ncbi:MAG TPA: peptidoglycan editing factor PgeF [Gammaproteobacteria bacterium]|nr:peptidoglycan editing factor PgeF [Gammaproteobacteria bacterium]
MLEVIEDASLKKSGAIKHAFFTRVGGVSAGIYSSLNCAFASNDHADNIRENRRRAVAQFEYPLESLITVRNIHSNRAIIIEQSWSEDKKPEADAMVTKLSKIVLGSDSADCPIILFADDMAGVIGLAHAGWRGAKAGIIENTVEQMLLLGAKPRQISAAVSPCIAQCSYEVSQEFQQQFLKESLLNRDYFISSNRENHFLFDLLGYVKNRLFQLNLRSVSSEVAFDTYSDEKRFFSCRRALHRSEPCFGGHLSCISLD